MSRSSKGPQPNGGGGGSASGGGAYISGESSGNSSGNRSAAKEKRFSIHDAFEEETDEAIRVYGSTVISTPVKAKTRSTEDVTIRVQPDARFVF